MRVDGYVGAGTDGQAHVGRGKGGSVVDAVADHADPAAFGLQGAYGVGLVLGQDLGERPFDADLGGDGGSRATVVTGQHDHIHAQLSQRADGRGRVLLDRVGHCEHPGRSAVDCGQHWRLALRGQPGRDRFELCGVDADIGE